MASIRVFHVAFFDAGGNRLLLLALLAHSELVAAYRALRISRDIGAADFYMTLEPQSARDNGTVVAIRSINSH